MDGAMALQRAAELRSALEEKQVQPLVMSLGETAQLIVENRLSEERPNCFPVDG
jgi:hypothetical protein